VFFCFVYRTHTHTHKKKYKNNKKKVWKKEQKRTNTQEINYQNQKQTRGYPKQSNLRSTVYCEKDFKMNKTLLFAFVLMMAALPACLSFCLSEPETVSELDPNAYVGVWYQIADDPFTESTIEQNAYCVTATCE